MKLRTRSILQELNSIADARSTDALVESRAANIIKIIPQSKQTN